MKKKTTYEWLNSLNDVPDNLQPILSHNLFIRDLLGQNEIPQLQKLDILVVCIEALHKLSTSARLLFTSPHK